MNKTKKRFKGIFTTNPYTDFILMTSFMVLSIFFIIIMIPIIIAVMIITLPAYIIITIFHKNKKKDYWEG